MLIIASVNEDDLQIEQPIETEAVSDAVPSWPMPNTPDAPRKSRLFRPALAFMVFAAIYIGMFLVGGEARRFVVPGLEVLPFAILAVLAHWGEENRSGKVATMVYWFVLAGAFGLFTVIFTVIGVLPAGMAEAFRDSGAAAEPDKIFGTGAIVRIAIAFLASLLSALIGTLCFLPAVRRAVAKILPIDAKSFVHATALAAVVMLTLSCLIPLVVAGKPPLLELVRKDGTLQNAQSLRDAVYALIWAVPAALLAVGYPQKRNLREVIQRLGIVWPSRRQIIFALLATIGSFVGLAILGSGIKWLWLKMAWNITDNDATKLLFGFAMGPVATLILGLSAGIGEEITFRGVIQPRMGIVLSASMFAALHAFQYGFDGLIQVLVLGLVLGVIRKVANTTTAAMVHWGYDVCALLATYFLHH
jgi:membrane protease YdiL (CAAX protease family)